MRKIEMLFALIGGFAFAAAFAYILFKISEDYCELNKIGKEYSSNKILKDLKDEKPDEHINHEEDHIKDCEYILPINCHLIFFPKSKKFGIRVNNSRFKNPDCLYYDKDMKKIYHEIIIYTKPSLFEDSCEAKYFCHKCVMQDLKKAKSLAE